MQPTNNEALRVFTFGRPTDHEVSQLLEAYPPESLTPGVKISYKDIAGVIEEKERSNRFKTVVSAWRKKLERSHNILFGCSPNNGYVVLDNSGRVSQADSSSKNAIKKLKISGERAAATSEEGLTEEEKRKRLHIQLRAGASILAAKEEDKKFRFQLFDASKSGSAK